MHTARRSAATTPAAITLAAVLALALAFATPSVLTREDARRQQLAERSDADYFETWFASASGACAGTPVGANCVDNSGMLHADVLRPRGYDLSDANPTPVILTVSPYLNHNGSTTDVDPFNTGVNARFFDFLDLSGALEQDYTYVMVDLPGNGGSSGCNDWGGIREQTAVRDAVEWAASQPWSTGKVALLGKSYDGWTGLMGIAQQPEGLAAVVSMEPVFAGYNYLYNNGVRKCLNSPATIALFQAIDAKPGSVNDDPQYHLFSAPQVWCYGVNLAGSQTDTPDSIYWAERNLLPPSDGQTTPLFLTQGFLETNTLPDLAFKYWNGMAGEGHRAWFGQFDHDRGWDRSGERYLTGRDTFIDEAMRFLDLHLKGIQPEVADPTIAVQDNLGRYRGEEQWPPADMRRFITDLNVGSYVDDGGFRENAPNGDALWSVSAPLAHDVWLSGEPTIDLTVFAERPHSNIAVNVYDIGPAGTTLVSRAVSLVRGLGGQELSLDLYGNDWVFEAGHRLGVSISSSNANMFTHVHTRGNVRVLEASIALPFLTVERTDFLDGESSPRLEAWRNRSFFVPDASSEIGFDLPGPLAPHGD